MDCNLLQESMIAGIPGIRAAGGSSKGEKGEVGTKGKLVSTINIVIIFPRPHFCLLGLNFQPESGDLEKAELSLPMFQPRHSFNSPKVYRKLQEINNLSACLKENFRRFIIL